MTESEKERQYQKVPTKELISDGIPEIPATYAYGIRHVQAGLLLFCLTISYSARAHLGVSVVAMTRHSNKTNTTINETSLFFNNSSFLNDTNVKQDVNKTSELEYILNDTVAKLDEENETTDSIWNVYRTYEWPKPIQELILDAFYLGYSLMMFPMGMICQRFGGKIPLQICLLVNGVVSFITPSLAVWGGWKAVCFCRVLQGLSQSGLYPSIQTVLAKWVPISERATFSSYVYTGSTIGTVIGFQTAGALGSSKAGWPVTFWLAGFICIGAFILISVFSAATPSDHKTISDEEKFFILGRVDDGIKKRTTTPWRQIFRSKHVWGGFATHVASGVCFVFLFTQIPTYMHYILGFNIKSSGFLSSLPYIAAFFFSIGYGIVSDFCTNRGIFSLKAARAISNSISQVGPALCLVAVSFTDNSTVAVILLVLAVGLFAGVHTGWMVNYIDLTPNFSGSIMAVGNTGTAFGTLAQPFLIANIVTDVGDRSQWRIILFLMAAIIVVCNTVFACFVSADPQPWDQIDSKDCSDPELLEDRKNYK